MNVKTVQTAIYVIQVREEFLNDKALSTEMFYENSFLVEEYKCRYEMELRVSTGGRWPAVLRHALYFRLLSVLNVTNN